MYWIERFDIVNWEINIFRGYAPASRFGEIAPVATSRFIGAPDAAHSRQIWLVLNSCDLNFAGK